MSLGLELGLRLVALCKDCHQATHMGYALVSGKSEGMHRIEASLFPSLSLSLSFSLFHSPPPTHSLFLSFLFKALLNI
jgi:hypothetical protein